MYRKREFAGTPIVCQRGSQIVHDGFLLHSFFYESRNIPGVVPSSYVFFSLSPVIVREAAAKSRHLPGSCYVRSGAGGACSLRTGLLW